MFINNFGWKTVAVLYEDIEKYSLAMNAIGADFALNNITITASLAFKEPSVEIPEKLQVLKDLDVRIILGAFSVKTARQVFCEAYRRGMYGPRYVWLLMGGFKADSWWRETAGTNCTARQLAAAVDSCFAVVSLNTLLGGLKSVANLTTTEFKEAYHANNGSTPMSFFAATTYDTVWTIALTLGTALTRWRRGHQPALPLHRMNYSSLAPFLDTYIDIIKGSRFDGVSGPVSFHGSDREGVSVIYQLQEGNFTRVAIHYPGSPRLYFDCDGCLPVVWQGGRVPRDKKVVKPKQRTIEAKIFYISAGCCGAGIFLALVFLQYNLYHRRLKYIKLSSPKLNNVAVIGCILVYSTVILMGLDDRTMPLSVFSVVCSVRVFLLAAGFSLSFGAMFAKTFRVHQIFTRANHGLVKSKLLRDRHLLFLIGGLLVVDSGVVCVWVIVDPMGPHVTNLTMESSEKDEDLVFLSQLTTCHSAHLQKWMGVFYAYKGLLLLFGVYMAWETRNVKIPALNDSQYIGFNVYNVVLVSVCVVVLSNILSSQPTLAYAIDSAFMVLSTTVTLCLLFVPKIYVIYWSGGDPVIASTGILVEANTRRFVVDDKKEIFYRAEVQNRVYKREIVELSQEISRMERLLTLPMEDCPRLAEELLYAQVDGRPDFPGRRRNLLERCNSISDGGEGVSYAREEHEDVLKALVPDNSRLRPGQHQALLSTPPMAKRHSTQDGVSSSAFKKLRLKNRSLSVSHTTNCTWKTRLKGKLSAAGAESGGQKTKYLRNNALECEESSMSFSSPPSSPDEEDCGRGMDKSRFAALLGEELADGGSLWSGGVDVSLLGLPGCGRARSYSASYERSAPTLDKVTQTSFVDSPKQLLHRLGPVYRVDTLELTEMEVKDMEDTPPCSATSSSSASAALCRWMLTGPSGCSPSRAGETPEDYADPFAPAAGVSRQDPRPTHSRSLEETLSSVLRPDSFPEQLSLCAVSARARSPCIRRANAVHFSPYNEVRFVDRTDISHSFLQAAAAESPASENTSPHSIPLSHLPAHSPCSDSQPVLSTNGHVNESKQPGSSGSSQSTPPLLSPRRSSSNSSDCFLPAISPASRNLKVAQTALENERRKRLRKLQHDLQRIQRELQDLDELEYDVTEV